MCARGETEVGPPAEAGEYYAMLDEPAIAALDSGLMTPSPEASVPFASMTDNKADLSRRKADSLRGRRARRSRMLEPSSARIVSFSVDRYSSAAETGQTLRMPFRWVDKPFCGFSLRRLVKWTHHCLGYCSTQRFLPSIVRCPERGVIFLDAIRSALGFVCWADTPDSAVRQQPSSEESGPGFPGGDRRARRARRRLARQTRAELRAPSPDGRG